MGVADMTVVHGEWCGAKTYPTTCRTCSAEVFYFSCGHGSKIFFKEPGYPWPIHDCEEAREEAWARGLRRFTDKNGDTVVELKPRIRVIRSLDKPASFGIEQDVIASARSAKRKKPQHPIVPIEPEGELSESHEGILGVKRPPVDPLKPLGMPDTAPERSPCGATNPNHPWEITVVKVSLRKNNLRFTRVYFSSIYYYMIVTGMEKERLSLLGRQGTKMLEITSGSTHEDGKAVRQYGSW